MCRKSSILIHAKNSEAVYSLFGLKLLWHHQRLSGLEVHDSALERFRQLAKPHLRSTEEFPEEVTMIGEIGSAEKTALYFYEQG